MMTESSLRVSESESESESSSTLKPRFTIYIYVQLTEPTGVSELPYIPVEVHTLQISGYTHPEWLQSI